MKRAQKREEKNPKSRSNQITSTGFSTSFHPNYNPPKIQESSTRHKTGKNGNKTKHSLLTVKNQPLLRKR